MDSKFKPIPGYNGYLISEDGVVYSEKTSHFMKIRMLGCYNYPVVVFYNNKKIIGYDTTTFLPLLTDDENQRKTIILWSM